MAGGCTIILRVTVLHVKGAASRKNTAQATAAFYDAMKIFHDKHYRAQYPAPVNWAVDLGVAAAACQGQPWPIACVPRSGAGWPQRKVKHA